jgi:hypothetical protein
MSQRYGCSAPPCWVIREHLPDIFSGNSPYSEIFRAEPRIHQRKERTSMDDHIPTFEVLRRHITNNSLFSIIQKLACCCAWSYVNIIMIFSLQLKNKLQEGIYQAFISSSVTSETYGGSKELSPMRVLFVSSGSLILSLRYSSSLILKGLLVSRHSFFYCKHCSLIRFPRHQV